MESSTQNQFRQLPSKDMALRIRMRFIHSTPVCNLLVHYGYMSQGLGSQAGYVEVHCATLSKSCLRTSIGSSEVSESDSGNACKKGKGFARAGV